MARFLGADLAGGPALKGQALSPTGDLVRADHGHRTAPVARLLDVRPVGGHHDPSGHPHVLDARTIHGVTHPPIVPLP